MTPQRRDQLNQEARAVLRANDRSGYTQPTAGLYPFQWDWDAGVSALGWITFDEPRAWDEFHWLLKGQWQGGANDGFIPHIVFHQRSDSYFPGPHDWATPKTDPPTSSISQPPLHATMLRWMWQRARDKALAAERLRTILPAIARHHAWWYRARDPSCTGLVTTVHPWESGRDNAPSWDEALARVPPTTRPYRRRDLDHVDAAERPTQAFYDRVVRLMDFNRECGFDPEVIARDCPFRVVDTVTVFILHRATKDLLETADELAIALPERSWLEAAHRRTPAAVATLWSQRLSQFVDRDRVADALIEQPACGGFLSWYAGIDRADQVDTLNAWLAETRHAVPSTRASAAAFEPRRYWRGPVWQHMNLLFETGLRECGHGGPADRIRASSLELFETSGFHEYYDPISGAGLGGRAFSWTAATWLWRQTT